MLTEQPHAICGAKTRAGHPCQQRPMPNGRCRMHGGATPAGVASPHFKHGRYSKLLPVRLAAAYEHARTDDDLLALREEAAVLQARIGDLLQRVDSGDSLKFWNEARQVLNDLEAAQTTGDAAAAADACGRLRTAITGARHDGRTWDEVGRTIDAFRRVSEAERKRLIDLQAMVTADEVMAFSAAVMSIVRECITDRAMMAKFQAGMQRIFEERHGRAA